MGTSFLRGRMARFAVTALTIGAASTALSERPQQPAPPCRIMPLVVPGRAAPVPSRAHLDYFGGRVVSNVELVQVLWGPGAYQPFVESTGPGSLASFFAAIAASPYLDAMAQYATDRPGANGSPGTGQHIGRGTFLRQVRIAPPAGALVADDEIVAELGRQIRAGALPRPSADAAGNANTLYTVYFPAGKTITVGGGASCATFCAYHGAFDLDGRNVYYAVMPDLSAGSGCDLGCGSGTPFENATSIASHELAEVITDPEVSLAAGFTAPLAWYDTFNGEAGDICNGISQPVTLGDGGRYAVQQFWSNADNSCSAGAGALTPPAVAATTVPAQPAAAASFQPAPGAPLQPGATVQTDAAPPAAAAIETGADLEPDGPAPVLAPPPSEEPTTAVEPTPAAGDAPSGT